MADVLWSTLDQKGVGGVVPWTMGYEPGGTREDIPGPGGLKSQQEPNSPQVGVIVQEEISFCKYLH